MTENETSEKQIEMGIASLDYMRSQMESVRSQIANLQGVVIDYESALQVLKELEKGSKGEIMVPIGGMVFLKAHLDDGTRCIADQGAGIYMEVGTSEGKTRIEKRKKKINEAISGLENNLSEINDRYRELSERTQQMYRDQLRSGQGPEQTF